MKISKYKLYVILYHLLFLGHVINSNIIPMEFILLFLITITLLEIPVLIKYPHYYLYLGTLAVLSAFLIYIRGFYNNGSLAIYFFFMPIIILSYKEKHIGYKVQLIPLILFLIYIIIQSFLGRDFNSMLDNQSRNMVSFYYLLYTIYYYIERYRYDGKIEYWPALLSLMISLFAVGRSGIISSTLLFIFIFFFKNKSLSSFERLKRLIPLILFLIVFIPFWGIILSFIGVSLSRLEELGITSGPRDLINTTYIHYMITNTKDLLLGVSLEDSTFSLFDYNLHNSYLSLHYFTGIFSVILLFVLVKCLFFTSGKIFYRLLLFVLLVRGYTDQVFFFNFNDIIIFYLIFLISDNNIESIEENYFLS